MLVTKMASDQRLKIAKINVAHALGVYASLAASVWTKKK